MDSVIEAVQKLKVAVTGATETKTATESDMDSFNIPICVSYDDPFFCGTDEANAADSKDSKPPAELLVCGTGMGYTVGDESAEGFEAESSGESAKEPPAEVSVSTPSSSTPSPSQLCNVDLLEITFNVLPDEDSDNDGNDNNNEMSPYIELGGSFQKSHDLCMDKDEIVLTNEQIVMRDDEPLEPNKPKHVTLILDYPLDDDYEFKIYPDDKRGFTRGHLIREIKRTYDRVYAEEEETTTVPVGNIPGMLNRVSTDGNYGVWGHDLGDLALHTVKYNHERNLFWLGVDS